MKYFTVGPSQEYPKLREFLQDGLAEDIHSISHRSARFVELFQSAAAGVLTLFGAPGDRSVVFAGSATEWMERSIQNLSRERTLHFVSGHFAKRFYDFSLEMGRDARKVDQQLDGSFRPEDIPADFSPELIALTHNETSNGTQLSEGFFTAIRARFPDALIALDVVSSAPVVPQAFMAVDVVFFSVQKGFGMPAGLGVAIVSPRAVAHADEVRAAGQYTGFFHSLPKLAEYAAKGNTVETPNVLGIYLLDRIVHDLAPRKETLADETAQKAALIREALARSTDVELEPIAPEYLSQTVIVAKTPGGSKPIIDRLKAQGITIASGYGTRKDTHIRIGNFPQHSREDVERLASLM